MTRKPESAGRGRGRIVAGGLAIAAAGALLATQGARAEDIDLYSASGAVGAANVMFLLDNTSNWSASNQAWDRSEVLGKCGTDKVCQDYVAAVFGTASSLTQGQVELRALKLVLNQLVCDPNGSKLNVNIGLMLLSADKGTVTGDDSAWAGAWVLKAIESSKDEGVCGRLIQALDTIDQKITEPAFKAASNANYGAGLFEAFKYFGGYAGPAGFQAGKAGSPVAPSGYGPDRYTNLYSLEDPKAFTDDGKKVYRSPANDSCGKNFLILVGNTFPNLESETSTTPKYDRILKNLGYSGTLPSTAKFPRYADEWADFIARGDASSLDGQQALATYTVNVFNKSEDQNQTNLLDKIAYYGGSTKSYKVGGDIKALVVAFQKIFTQVSAENSVFASTSLPVSANAQGTFLNQVFVGMFRPDGKARPRWAGNIKQYQLALDGSGNVFLADKTGEPALNNTNTGFIDSCATSFWTTDSGDYWANVPSAQTPAGACESAQTLKTSDSPDGDIVEKGGAGQLQRAAKPGDRIVQTCSSPDCSDVVELTPTSGNALAVSLGLPAPSADLVNWIRGQNTGDGNQGDTGTVYELYGTLGTNKTRPTVHGEVVHARPLAINYGTTTNDVVLFYGSGDGLLRAVDGNRNTTNSGKELWSFFAPEFLARMNRLRENSPLIAYPSVPLIYDPKPQPKDYFFDGAIGAYQQRDTDGVVSKVWLYPTMRRGGRQVYAFDASSRPRSGDVGSTPALKWKFGCPDLGSDTGCTTGASNMGQSWSTPRVLRVAGSSTLYLAFGAGHDNCEDTDSCGGGAKGRGIFVLNAASGDLVSFIDLAAISSEAGSVVADVVPVDVNGDGYADLLYAVDTRGNVWRTNLSDPLASTPYTGYAPDAWAARTFRIAKVANWSGAATAQHRKFQYSPDVVVLGGTAHVFVGSGDREKPLMGSSATKVKNRFYGLRDNYDVGASGVTVPTLTDDSTDCDAAGDTARGSCDLLNVTAVGLDYRAAFNDPKLRGWVIDLATTAVPFEQVVTSPVTVGGAVYFSTFQANDPGVSGNSCKLGTGRGYAVNFLTGGLRPGDDARAIEFVGGGIPPTPVAGIVEIDNKKVPFILGGRQPVKSSVLEGSKVPIAIKAVRKKVYRYEKIDK